MANKTTINFLRLGFVWTSITQTANALALTSSILDYGEFAIMFVGAYRRIQKPIFDWLSEIGSAVGIDLSLFQLDIISFYVLLSVNVYLAIPLVVKREPRAWTRFEASTRPLDITRIAFRNVKWGTWGTLKLPRSLWTRIRAPVSELNLIKGYRGVVAVTLYCLGMLPIAVFSYAILITMFAIVWSFGVFVICFEIIMRLLLLPLFPLIVSVFYAWALARSILQTYRRESNKVDFRQSGRIYLSKVLPWFIPLLTIIVGVFVVHTIDGILDRVI